MALSVNSAQCGSRRLLEHCGEADGELPGTLALISSQAFSIINFRSSLIADLVGSGVRVWALAPDYNEELRESVASLGATPIDYSLSRTGMNPLRDWIDTLRLAKILRRLRPDATLANSMKPITYGTIASRLAGVPRRYALVSGLGFFFVDDGEPVTIRRRLLRYGALRLYRFSLLGARCVIVQNRDDLQEFDRNRVLKPAQVELVPGSGVDLAFFLPAPPITSPVTFLFLSRMLREKGVNDFVEAARLVKKRSPGIRFLLVGDSDLNPGAICNDQLQSWHDEGVVEWVGRVRDVRPWLADSSVVVLPSYYREGVPRSIQEAMAMGRPVISTDSPGCRETVVEGRNGFLVPVRDPGSLATAMLRFVSNPDLIVSMGVAGRQLAEERFDVRIINRRMLAALRR